jgi:hypothetical protein
MARASLLVRAMELAESGEHIDCLTVESALAVEGYAEAFDVFKRRPPAGWHPLYLPKMLAANCSGRS